MLTRPGHGVPGIHGGEGVGVGAGVGTGVGDGVGAGVGERVGDGEGEDEGDGEGSALRPMEPQAVRRAAVAKASVNAAARRARRRPLSPPRRLAAIVGVVRQRMNIAGRVLGRPYSTENNAAKRTNGIGLAACQGRYSQ
jgi:hypothetical protein